MAEDTTDTVPNAQPGAEAAPADRADAKPDGEAKPKRRRRSAKASEEPRLPLEAAGAAPEAAPSAPKPEPGRPAEDAGAEGQPARRRSARRSAATGEAEGEAPAPRRRGRPRKAAPKGEGEQAAAPAAEGGAPALERTSSSDGERGARGAQAADEGGSERGDEPAGGKAPAGAADAAQADEQAAHDDDQGRNGRHRRHTRDRNRNRNVHPQQPQGGTQQAQGNNGRRRNNRRGAQPERAPEPTLTMEALGEMKVAELRSKAAELKVEYVGLRKAELTRAVYEAAAISEGFRPVEGILDIQSEGYGFLRTGNYMQGDEDAFVHQHLIRQYGLRTGDKVKGTMSPGRSNKQFPPLGRIDKVNDQDPELARSRPRFRDLTPIYPNERLVMEHGKDSITGRAIDLVAPIGKGQRGLIVSPPKAGKTTVLKNICQSISANNPEVHLFCLLVDERPEEVTDMERSIRGEVVASTFDMPASNHTAVSELVIEHAKRLVEMGEDVVVVLDSITRLARAYNLAAPASGRILSGGVDSAALYPPKKFLGAARNIENGGSLTILASALVDTGSKMDEVIFEEFKGTGNMELKLDRELADKRVFPAIDPVASGTRNEELLLDAQMTPFIWGLRRVLANMNNTERAATALVKGLRATKDNEEFLIRSAKKAQQMDYL
ncbi:MAG: transcription termination factor Rho [Olsenella sp.]|jgi:transcription termination factor Rho